MNTAAPKEPIAAPAARFSRLASLVARNRNRLLLRKAARFCERYLDWYANLNYDLRTNGETFVLRTLAQFQPRVIFDVGANVGDWSLAAKRNCPHAEIHAFEIAPPTFEILTARTRHLPDVQCRKVGLSDSAGFVSLRFFDALPALTTSVAYPHPLPFSELSGEVVTGDSYASNNGIDHIDLLKIDVEGMEENVLRGFQGMFEDKAIDLVQFEYGRVSIVNHFLLRDFFTFFRDRGFAVGKIFPHHVAFREYDLGDEDFRGPNYLACRQEKSSYLRVFGAGCAS